MKISIANVKAHIVDYIKMNKKRGLGEYELKVWLDPLFLDLNKNNEARDIIGPGFADRNQFLGYILNILNSNKKMFRKGIVLSTVNLNSENTYGSEKLSETNYNKMVDRIKRYEATSIYKDFPDLDQLPGIEEGRLYLIFYGVNSIEMFYKVFDMRLFFLEGEPTYEVKIPRIILEKEMFLEEEM